MKTSLVFLLLFTFAANAQELFPNLLTPAFRGNAGSELSQWDIFSEAYNVANPADVISAGSNPTIIQNLTDTAFISSGFNIYSFAAATGFELANNTSTSIGVVQNVVFQYDSLGTAIDFNTIRLNSGAQSYAATNFITESRVINGGFGGFTIRSAVQWNLTGLGVSNYTITFAAAGSHNSFNFASLDASSAAFSEVVPSARTWDGGGTNNQWSTAANWSADQQTSQGGNITFTNAAPAQVNLDFDRDTGLITIDKTSPFEISGSSLLKINTGVNLVAGVNSEISAPIFLGGHGFFDVGEGGTLILSGVISGAGITGSYPATGILKTGLGTLQLDANNSFTGGLTVDGGTLISAGLNAYTGSTSIVQGHFIAKNNAPHGAVGALGNATSNVALGSGGTFGDAGATLLIDGDFTVARNIAITTGGDAKTLGAQNTSSGALFTGNIALASGATNLKLLAANATDRVSFSGAISGGSTANTLTKDGAGTVIFSGTSKTYANATTVSGGTLQIDGSFTGNGNLTVASGARLTIGGTLGGSGNLVLNSGIIGGSGTIGRVFTLDSGDRLAPGNSPGTLNTVSQTWAGGGEYLWEINDVNAGFGTGWDFVNITGTLTLTATHSHPFVLRLSTLTLASSAGNIHDFQTGTDYLWKIASASNGITGFDPAQFTIDTTNFSGLNGNFTITQAGNDLSLAYAAIPEPSSVTLIIGAALLLSFFQKRKPQTTNPKQPTR